MTSSDSLSLLGVWRRKSIRIIILIGGFLSPLGSLEEDYIRKVILLDGVVWCVVWSVVWCRPQGV